MAVLNKIAFTSREQVQAALPSRSSQFTQEVERQTTAIIAKVASGGDQGLSECISKFEGRDASMPVEVPPEEWTTRAKGVPAELASAIDFAASRIQRFHEKQLPHDVVQSEDDEELRLRYTPLSRVGLYVPGGTAAYPSSVLMTAIPAAIAGVKDIIMATPDPTDAVLRAAQAAGVTRVFRMGGAHAVAALAYGTESVPKVDKIVGPGNQWVACAKRQVFGLVDIDSIAGPSEVLIWAEGDVNSSWLAADMLAQAEHDVEARVVVVSSRESLMDKLEAELSAQLPKLEREATARQALERYGTFIHVPSRQAAIDVINDYAPEHLEVVGAEPESSVDELISAGAIFVGPFVPEAAGDYTAGPNHVLPTGGTANYASPLGTTDFMRATSILTLSKKGLQKQHRAISEIARAEGLTAHARSVDIRFED